MCGTWCGVAPGPLLGPLLLVVGDDVLGPGHLLGGRSHSPAPVLPALPLTRSPNCLCHIFVSATQTLFSLYILKEKEIHY